LKIRMTPTINSQRFHRLTLGNVKGRDFVNRVVL
jgi:hypothetical protein